MNRMPAEWEPHAATWIGWPHHHPDWPGKFEPIPWVYAEIARVLHRSEPIEILCGNEQARENASSALRSHGVNPERCRLHIVQTDRVWLRDSAPTAVHRADGSLQWIGWQFNAWAKYENFHSDANVGRAVSAISGVELVEAMRPDGGGRLVLEGGAIDANGAGALLTTEECLLSKIQERNPGLDRSGYEKAFAEYLGITRTIWLGEGCAGDDTHGHVDDVARFTSTNTIALAYEADPADENHERSRDNFRRLELASKHIPGGLRIARIPFPRAVIMDGERLPASYANFYVANSVVIVPTFNDVADRVALAALAELFPEREVVGIHAVDLVWGLGTLHCLTQQQPAPALRP